MFDFVRLTTLHPAFVHLPLGAIPLLLFAYAVAAAKRSERWMFAGDVALGFAAVFSAIAAGLGYLAYFELDWPGGLQPWPLVHLVLGTLTTLAVWVFGVMRWRAVKAEQSTSRATEPLRAATSLGWALGAAAVTALAMVTGYIGGELLVFHAGMAVKATADGALSPPLMHHERSPDSLHVMMQRLRPLWASNVDLIAHAVVAKPSDADYDQLADNARRIQKLASWLVDWESKPGDAKSASDAARRADMRQYASELHDHAQHLEQTASKRELTDSISALSDVTRSCAECHSDERWKNTRVTARR